LTGIGQLSLAAVREVLTAVDGPSLPLRDLPAVLVRAIAAEQVTDHEVAGTEAARGHVDKFLDGLGWRVPADSPGRQTLAQVLAALRHLGWDADAEVLLPYAAAAQTLARHEQASQPDDPARIVAGSVLFGVALTAMRGLAQEDAANA
jgi:hypothetical protein